MSWLVLQRLPKTVERKTDHLLKSQETLSQASRKGHWVFRNNRDARMMCTRCLMCDTSTHDQTSPKYTPQPYNRQWKAWWKSVQDDINSLGPSQEDAQIMIKWEEIKGQLFQFSLIFCWSFLLLRVYTVSQKKLCQLIFCSLPVKYEPISVKIGMIVPEETLKKTVPKMPTSPKVCDYATLGNLKCQIEPSTQ